VDIFLQLAQPQQHNSAAIPPKHLTDRLQLRPSAKLSIVVISNDSIQRWKEDSGDAHYRHVGLVVVEVLVSPVMSQRKNNQQA